MKFPCTKCGVCCEASYAIACNLPVKGGYCFGFDQEKRVCVGYDARPAVCRVSEGSYEEMALACNTVQSVRGVPESYRVKL